MSIEIKDEVEKKTVATGAAMQPGPVAGQILVTHCQNLPGQTLKVNNYYSLLDTATGQKTAAKCLHLPGAGMQTATFLQV